VNADTLLYPVVSVKRLLVLSCPATMARPAQEWRERRVRQRTIPWWAALLLLALPVAAVGVLYAAHAGGGLSKLVVAVARFIEPVQPPSRSTGQTARLPISAAAEPAKALAFLDTDNLTPPTALIALYQTQLDVLASNCRDKSQADLAGLIVVAQRQLREYGQSLTLLRIASNAATLSERSPGSGIPCHELVATWVFMSRPRP